MQLEVSIRILSVWVNPVQMISAGVFWNFHKEFYGIVFSFSSIL
jgi:hypothetical protein